MSYSRTISHTIGWKDTTGDRHERGADVRRHRVSDFVCLYTALLFSHLLQSVTFSSRLHPFQGAPSHERKPPHAPTFQRAPLEAHQPARPGSGFLSKLPFLIHVPSINQLSNPLALEALPTHVDAEACML